MRIQQRKSPIQLKTMAVTQSLFAKTPVGKEDTTILGVTDPAQEEAGLLSHNGSRGEHTWYSGDTLGCLLVIP